MKKKYLSDSSYKLFEALVIVFEVVFVFGLLFVYLFISSQSRNIINSTNELNSKIETIKTNIVTYDNQITGLNEEIDSLSDVESLIVEYKNAYPVLAKQLEEDIMAGRSDAKIAYLTFDDGPYLLTNKFLDVLDKYDVKATFFQLQKDENTGYDEDEYVVYDKIYQRIISSGHTLGNHTSSHKTKYLYSDSDAFMEDLLKNRDFIKEHYGYTTDIMRFPGGISTSKGLKDELIERVHNDGYVYCEWNSITGDGNTVGPSVDQSIANVLDTTKNRNMLVILMHDYSNTTLKALPSIIEGLENQGYILLPLFHDSQVLH